MSNKVISLFSGIGGLDLGFEAAGCPIALAVESDSSCRAILQRNRPSWQLSEPGDIGRLFSDLLLDQAGAKKGEPALLIGGPPCQPFSKSRLWVDGSTPGFADSRATTIQELFRVLGDTLPQVVVIENVSGFAAKVSNSNLPWIKENFAKVNGSNGTRYAPVVVSVNAAEYGVPQLRKRTFVIAEREGRRFQMPSPTHMPRVSLAQTEGRLEPIRTAWDAIGDLDTDNSDPALRATGKWADLLPSIPEGENYLWHTSERPGMPLFGWRTRYWSFLLKLSKRAPSWTLQASPGPATGPFHWRNRRLSVREMARLQTFPDWYEFGDGYRETTRQLGNAVPPALSEVIARAVMSQFFGLETRSKMEFQISMNNTKIRRHPIRPVPNKYLKLARRQPAHPGVGKGPRARATWNPSGA